MLVSVRIIARSTILAFVSSRVDHKDRQVVNQQLDDWYRFTMAAHWNNSADLKLQFGNASIVSASRVVFNIKGNDYRLVVSIEYPKQSVTVIWLGTHKEYDRIDVRKVEYDKTRYFRSRDRD